MRYQFRFPATLKFLVALAPLVTLGAPLQAQTVTDQKMAVPSYFYPGQYWEQLIRGTPTVGLAIINPGSGPGPRLDQNYYDTVRKAKAAGVRVLGYVYTNYGKRSTTYVKQDIDKYYRWYGVDGIFLDEAATATSKCDYYKSLYRYVKAKGGAAKVVINPGVNTDECYIGAADIIVNFEGPYDKYMAWALTSSSWEYKYAADRFWHLIYAAGNTQALESAIARSKDNHGGWIYVTPDILPNPWDTLPANSSADSYWCRQLGLISDGAQSCQ